MSRKRAAPRVTVLMPVYNGGRHLASAVDSILCQTYSDIEFLIIDDGSTDGSSELLRQLTDPRVRVIHQENQGLVAALNRGLAEATTELVARMDADDLSEPHRLAVQAQFLGDNPGVAAVGCCYDVIDESGRREDSIHVAAGAAYLRRQLYFRNVLAHGSMMFRLSVVRQLGGYREVGPVEDYDLWSRLAAKHDLAGLPEMLFSYRMTEGGISLQAREHQKACLSGVREMLHRDSPMARISARQVYSEGRIHSESYSHTCSRPLEHYVFDHAWLALLMVKRRHLRAALPLALGVLGLILRYPRAIRGVPPLNKVWPGRRRPPAIA